MMNANLPVGTEVVQKTTHTKTGVVSSRYGVVVEIGTGRNAGRLRIRWSHSEWNGNVRQDGKRTWMRADRVQVLPKLTGDAFLPDVVEPNQGDK
jgi:hypothetical protein